MWIVEVLVAADAVELVSGALWGYGPTALVESADSMSSTTHARDDNAPDNNAYDDNPSDNDTAVSLSAGFEVEAQAVRAAAAVRAMAGVVRSAPALTASISEVPDDGSWAHTWHAGASPATAGPFFVRLTHHRPSRDRIDLVIEPGTAFGFSHPSTRLALAELTPALVSGATVADIGTGSGVLAVGAALAGARLVDAVDIDADAVASANNNASANCVPVNAIHGDVGELPGDDYDVVVANMTARLLVAHATPIQRLTRSGGTVVLSGMLSEQLGSVLGAFGATALDHTSELDQWSSARLRMTG